MFMNVLFLSPAGLGHVVELKWGQGIPSIASIVIKISQHATVLWLIWITDNLFFWELHERYVDVIEIYHISMLLKKHVSATTQ